VSVVSDIARRLTDAQAVMILASVPDDIDGLEGVGVELHGADYRVARKLESIGCGHYTHGSPYYDMYWSNALGLRVRDYLRTHPITGTPS